MSDVVIRVEHLSKMYKLGVTGNDTFFKDVQSWFARKMGKDDPNASLYDNRKNPMDFWALKDISFDIHKGDRVAFIGRNGAGKSTLLKILSRITTPTLGLVKIRGRVSSLLEVGTGFHGELTGRENIYLNGSILGMKKKEIDSKLDAIIDFSGISKHIDTPVKRYSSGMAVRLGFAVASHLNCDILIADEVLAVGDLEFQKKALGKMGELSATQGRTILFVSHNLVAVKALCNKGFILEKGELVSKTDDIDVNLADYVKQNTHISETIPFDSKNIDRNIELFSIKVNGKSESIADYVAGDTLKIEIAGKTRIKQNISIELRLKSEMGAPLAYYNRGHFEKFEEIEVGDFTLKEELKIENIITGRYIVDLYLVNPAIAMLAFIENAFTIDATGVNTVTGVSLHYNDVGVIKID
ncbi:MAG: ABC transporter ATP-binding protein [Treponema sp.]